MAEKKLNSILITLLFLSLSIYSLAQKKYALKTLEEYQQYNTVYQNWLKNIGVADILSVKQIEIYDNQLTLYLEILGENQNDKLSKWFGLLDYYKKNKDFPLYKQLYKNMINIYKVSPDKANIQIWEGAYFYGIYYDDTLRKIDYKENTVRNIVTHAEVELNSSNYAVSQIRGGTTKAIYDRILVFSKRYFQNKVENFNRDFSYESTRRGTRPLKFTVNNMRQEVLYDEDNIFICDMINWFIDTDKKIDCRPKEYLAFTITVKINEEDKIAEIEIDVAGKYAAFLSNNDPRYYNDMEEDFSYYLKIYTRKFTNEIENYLNN